MRLTARANWILTLYLSASSRTETQTPGVVRSTTPSPPLQISGHLPSVYCYECTPPSSPSTTPSRQSTDLANVANRIYLLDAIGFFFYVKFFYCSPLFLKPMTKWTCDFFWDRGWNRLMSQVFGLMSKTELRILFLFRRIPSQRVLFPLLVLFNAFLHLHLNLQKHNVLVDYSWNLPLPNG